MPAVFDLSLVGRLDVESAALERLSLSSAVVLITAYAGSLIYAFTAQKDLFRPMHEGEHGKPALPIGAAVGVLAAGTVLTTVQAEILVGAMEPALVRFDFTELFVGVIVIALIGNAAEHYSAVTAARRDEMTLAVEIAVGSSAQIALLVAPALVLYSFAIGRPMSLLFNGFEITAIALSVLATSIVVVDGESNWVEGCRCCRSISSSRSPFILCPGPAEVRGNAIITADGRLERSVDRGAGGRRARPTAQGIF
jgi:Ca2+:H+ antiporter